MAGAVYRVFNGDYNAHQEHPGGLFVSASIGPMHRECALYSACGCPFLRYPSSTQKMQSPNPGFAGNKTFNRGPAQIVGFRRYGVYFLADATEYGQRWAWGYLDPAERIPYVTFKDVARLYESAVESSAIDTTGRLYFRAESTADRRHLEELNQGDVIRLSMLRASALTLVAGKSYPLALL